MAIYQQHNGPARPRRSGSQRSNPAPLFPDQRLACIFLLGPHHGNASSLDSGARGTLPPSHPHHDRNPIHWPLANEINEPGQRVIPVSEATMELAPGSMRMYGGGGIAAHRTPTNNSLEFLALASDDSHAHYSNPAASPRDSTPSTDQRPGEMSSAAATNLLFSPRTAKSPSLG
jgi:hypothetical protein